MNLSSHFKHSLTALLTLAVCLVAGFLGVRRLFEGQSPSVAPSQILGKNDRERIKYNSTSHILEVTTEKGTTRSYTRNPEILMEKNGSVVVKKHYFSFEHQPFLGYGYSFSPLSVDRNAYLGVNLLNAWRFDAGPAIALRTGNASLLLQGQYNFVSNTSLMGGWWFGTYHAALAVRF